MHKSKSAIPRNVPRAQIGRLNVAVLEKGPTGKGEQTARRRCRRGGELPKWRPSLFRSSLLSAVQQNRAHACYQLVLAPDRSTSALSPISPRSPARISPRTQHGASAGSHGGLQLDRLSCRVSLARWHWRTPSTRVPRLPSRPWPTSRVLTLSSKVRRTEPLVACRGRARGIPALCPQGSQKNWR